MYKITDYSKKQADILHVKIKPSNKKNKKIDVIKNGHVILLLLLCSSLFWQRNLSFTYFLNIFSPIFSVFHSTFDI